MISWQGGVAATLLRRLIKRAMPAAQPRRPASEMVHGCNLRTSCAKLSCAELRSLALLGPVISV